MFLTSIYDFNMTEGFLPVYMIEVFSPVCMTEGYASLCMVCVFSPVYMAESLLTSNLGYVFCCK